MSLAQPSETSESPQESENSIHVAKVRIIPASPLDKLPQIHDVSEVDDMLSAEISPRSIADVEELVLSVASTDLSELEDETLRKPNWKTALLLINLATIAFAIFLQFYALFADAFVSQGTNHLEWVGSLEKIS